MNAKKIVDWLKLNLGNDYFPAGNRLWIEHEYVDGNTEIGFSSAYSIDFERLESEMDKWIAEQREKQTPP